jgi:phenylacetate-CoA ligase
MLVIRGINIFPSQIEHVLVSLPDIGNHFMVYIDRINHMDEMTIEVEINRAYFSGELRDLAHLRGHVTSELHNALGIRTAVKLVEPGSLPRFEGKAKRVVDRRGQLW